MGSPCSSVDRLDRDPETPQLILVALELPAAGLGLLAAALVSGHAGDEVVERDRVAMGQEDREDVDPALDLGWWFRAARHGNDGVLDRVRGDS